VSYWFRNDQRLPRTRLTIVSYVIVGLVALLLLGFWKLQVIDSERYLQLAERNRVRSIPIIAPRGIMYDREGRVLVDNYPSFSVLLLRDDPVLVARNLPQVAEGLNIPLDDLRDQVQEAAALPKFQPIVIKPEASQADIAYIESHRADLPILEMVMVHRRRYLPGGFMAHAAGYVGEVSEQQIEASNERLRPGDIAGKSGLEKQYNDILMGTDGMRRVIVNSLGKEVGRLSQQEAVPGQSIQLTIDYDLQAAAEQSLGARIGAVVALDPRTGEVLAMASHPAPDPNAFAVRVPKEEWERLNTDPDRPLLDRSIQAQLAPGSVFKIVMATAMLESKAIPSTFKVFCPGYANFYGRMFKDWVYGKGSHGEVDLHKAIVQSCDVYFYNVGQRLGIDRISYYASALGFGRKTGIDLPSEETGLVPSEDWVQRVFHRKWYAGETISVSIGQGAVTVTPIQVAHTIGGVAMGGIFMQPHLLKNARNVGEVRFPLSDSTVEEVTEGMYGVINEVGGTGASLRLQNVDFCGKSGTAQLVGLDSGNRAGKKARENNAWFVGFGPRRNPEIVVAAVVQDTVEHGGTAAGPVVREVVKTFFDKKARKEAGQYTAVIPVMPQRVQNGGTPGAMAAAASGSPQANALLAREARRPAASGSASAAAAGQQ